MAGAILCVSCASLPLKDRKAALRTTTCPECQTACGVTAYGVTFRIEPGQRSRYLAPAFITGMLIGTGLVALVLVVTGIGLWTKERLAGPEPVPPPPVAQDLLRVPEVAVDDAFPAKIESAVAKRRIQNLITKINTTNTPDKRDAFVLANLERRPELRGLPFVMGDACRLDGNRAQSFQTSVQAVRDGLEADMHTGAHAKEATPFWNTYLAETQGQGIDTDHSVAALTQILGPERKTLRADLVRKLRVSNRPEAIKAIARAAIFDADGEVRMVAVKALKDDQKAQAPEVTDILMHGIRYPLASVAKRSAQVMIMLDRKDLLPQLVDVLGEPAPGDPVATTVNDEKVSVVREVVRINHHRNCLLCHPPSQTGEPQEVPGVIPIPGSPFPTSPTEAYGNAKSFGEPMVRADTTYLRQDFSVMMPVANAAPRPELPGGGGGGGGGPPPPPPPPPPPASPISNHQR